ncbi:recombinase family protein [Nocardia sp. CA-084685]|uniref:recombinase family protein n=1 Tax=Nocardia sp. CA-084685 TaxID=3239970 RepID=UPI003D989979
MVRRAAQTVRSERRASGRGRVHDPAAVVAHLLPPSLEQLCGRGAVEHDEDVAGGEARAGVVVEVGVAVEVGRLHHPHPGRAPYRYRYQPPQRPRHAADRDPHIDELIDLFRVTAPSRRRTTTTTTNHGNDRSRDTLRPNSFPQVAVHRICNGCRVRTNVNLSGVRNTLPRMRIGYGQVSTRDQHPEAQHDALTAAGWEQIFIDKASGKLGSRPELSKALLVANRPKDQLVVTKLDRLGRSLEHLIELSKTLQDRGVDLVVLDQGIDTSTAVGRMFFQILGAIAEFEHALMSERTRDGLAAARARGRTGGQKPKLGPRQVALARQMYNEHDKYGKRRYTVDQIAAEFGVTRPTIYRHLNRTPP